METDLVNAADNMRIKLEIIIKCIILRKLEFKSIDYGVQMYIRLNFIITSRFLRPDMHNI
jgi:hypothetical protein